jgi:hypothetical protein
MYKNGIKAHLGIFSAEIKTLLLNEWTWSKD